MIVRLLIAMLLLLVVGVSAPLLSEDDASHSNKNNHKLGYGLLPDEDGDPLYRKEFLIRELEHIDSNQRLVPNDWLNNDILVAVYLKRFVSIKDDPKAIVSTYTDTYVPGLLPIHSATQHFRSLGFYLSPDGAVLVNKAPKLSRLSKLIFVMMKREKKGLW